LINLSSIICLILHKTIEEIIKTESMNNLEIHFTKIKLSVIIELTLKTTRSINNLESIVNKFKIVIPKNKTIIKHV